MASYLTLQFNAARRFAEIENTILLGQQGDSIAGEQERSATANKSNSTDNQKQEAKDKKLSEFLHAYQIMQDYIDRLAKSIEQLENAFRQRDGEEWREKLALKILSEDDIPQQEPGETIQAYRERLEILLINEMLNVNGSIKGEYKNHPELADYAQWAQKQYHLNSARTAVNELENPNTSLERRNEIFDEFKKRSDIEELTYADHEATTQSTTQSQIKDIVDTGRTQKHDNVQSSDTKNDFLKPIS